MLVKVTNLVNAEKGDLVEFYIDSSFQLKCTFIIYMIPVLGLLAGALSAAPLAPVFGLRASFAIVLFTFIGLLLAVLLSKAWIHRITTAGNFLPIIKRVFLPGNPR